jgi:hypothetical protein
LLLLCRNVEQAEDILMEVIRQVPNEIQPYITLAQMKENSGRPGDRRKALSFYMLAAQISPKVRAERGKGYRTYEQRGG